MADTYYSLIARAVSRFPLDNDELRHAIYQQARRALQERLSTFHPPLSDADLENEYFKLEAAISRVEEELLLSVMRRFVMPRPAPISSFTSRAKEFVRAIGDKFKSRSSS